jgi:hypothetical protein
MKRFLLCLAMIAACGPGRTTFQQYPGAPATFEKAASEPKAVEIAEKVFAAAGGANWNKAKQIHWRQVVTSDGKQTLDLAQWWDRWNARHRGQLHNTDATSIVVGYELYGKFSMGYAQQAGKGDIEEGAKQNLDEKSRAKYLAVAKEVYNVDTAVLTMQFLMLEPGAKLAYVGQVKDDKGNDHYDELKVTFADPLRKDLEFHPVVDRNTNTIARIEIVKAGTNTKVGYSLSNWAETNGMKFATARGNLGYSGETIAIKDIKIGDVDDRLFIAPITH